MTTSDKIDYCKSTILRLALQSRFAILQWCVLNLPEDHIYTLPSGSMINMEILTEPQVNSLYGLIQAQLKS